ncbi:hypothetical protein [Rickettsiales endosymbiont of Stachyamoeba lipophora]|uniref:hypothetical protein n=1 Tax=Rickettsiales endosymbiont of Stachyamoeba lipophora TaxID=2486578 RepID=UPI000F64C7E7|nr:hypothetical protein [Rickettsiales endosymbiont of Stachyamoeba lipophora]
MFGIIFNTSTIFHGTFFINFYIMISTHLLINYHNLINYWLLILIGFIADLIFGFYTGIHLLSFIIIKYIYDTFLRMIKIENFALELAYSALFLSIDILLKIAIYQVTMHLEVNYIHIIYNFIMSLILYPVMTMIVDKIIYKYSFR